MDGRLDYLIILVITAVFIVLILNLLLKKFKQPHFVGYIIAGTILGPYVLGLVNQTTIIEYMGHIGVIFLLFFVGMGLSPKRLVDNWFISVFGTILQILISVTVITFISDWYEWSWPQAITLGFIISLSSTSVVFKLLQDAHDTESQIGQDVIGILIVQDILVIPMLIIISLLTANTINYFDLTLQLVGGALMIILTSFIVVKGKFDLPILKTFGREHETQLLLSLLMCFGIAAAAVFFRLPPGLGAFLGGMLVASIPETSWVKVNLLPLKTLFLAFFFISIGMLLNPLFILDYFWEVVLLTAVILTVNTFINSFILKVLGESWKNSIYGGSLLCQIGEFSFILATVGFHAKLFTFITYQTIDTVIALSILLCPLWILTAKNILKK